MIPVFTVIKNGVILKNIFVVNKPPSPLSDLSSFALVENAESSDQETEEILIAGRHPNCNIVLMHPSISRFHFQINSKPSLQKLFVTDLSSVHGTWVSEKKIDPGFRAELKEGDTIRVGGSTRLYTLHWLPLSRVYDMENAFVSESDLSLVEEKEEENVEKMSQNVDLLVTENKSVDEKDSLVVLGKVEDTNENIDSFASQNGEIQSVNSISEGVLSLFPDENSGLIVKKEIPSAPVMSRDMNSFHDGIEQIENSSRKDHELILKSVGGVTLQNLSAIFSENNQSPEYHSADEENEDISMTRLVLESHDDVSSDSPSSVTELDSAFKVPKETKSQYSLRKDHKHIDTFSLQHVHMSMPAGEPSHVNNEYVNEENQRQDDLAASDPLCEEGNRAENQQLTGLGNLQILCSDDPSAAEILDAMENQNPLSKEGILSKFTIVCAVPLETEESVNSSMPLGEVLSKSKESQTPQSDFPETGNSESIMSPADEESIDISMTRVELESHVVVSSYSPSSVTELDSAFKLPQEPRSQSLLGKESKQIDTFPLQSVHLPMPAGEPSETNNEHIKKDKQSRDALHPLCEEGNQKNTTENQQLIELVKLQNICSHDLAAAEILEQMENQSPLRKEGILNEFRIVSAVPFEKEESVISSMPLAEVLSMSKGSQSPQSEFPATGNSGNIIGSPIRSEKKSGFCNIWSRRGKPAPALQLQTSRSQRKTRREEENDGDAELENCKNVKSQSISRALFDLEAMKEEIFTPDKENCTSNTSILRSLKKDRLENIQLSKSGRSSSSKIPFSPSTRLEDDMIFSSDKKNQTPRFLQERKSSGFSRHHFKLEEDIVPKERRAGRAPLQTLILNSPLRSMSEASVPSAAIRSSSSISCNQNKVTNSTSINSIGDGRRRWTMIADTTSLLDNETRKALQLLEGLKGTHLIIPRMVIRELDSLKRCGSLLRRTTEASMASQWIEECLVKTKWWIHVQSSVEEVMPIAPTPPASLVSGFSGGSELLPHWKRISASFSALGSPLEIVSPTAEDHILDCALSCRKMNNDGQLVLLSNNVTLKIKAMTEGMICETAQEFRDSLVNPFSERFLWAESSPRGQTWSVFDDVMLKENYYRSPSKKSSRGEAAKGLKLILLHNSHYAQTTPFVKTM